MIGPKIRRVYYSSTEVCRIADISQNRLRSWERRIAELQPARNRSGRKCYKPDQLTLLKKIVKFKNVGYTDEKILELLRRRTASGRELSDGQRREPFVQELRQGLQDILNIIDGSHTDAH